MNTEIPSEMTTRSTKPKWVCKVLHHSYTKINRKAQKKITSHLHVNYITAKN